ncbi:hypothetical protein ACEQUB_00154 [Ralstonia syzygii]|uniref:Transmembrane protein n=1 Tax=Ralstonia syzygii R24 TaxID=907261 RepID=G3A3U4_9RALS|nr:hypothetical protein RALSY_30301 [Ralstonia syzygii R24]
MLAIWPVLWMVLGALCEDVGRANNAVRFLPLIDFAGVSLLIVWGHFLGLFFFAVSVLHALTLVVLMWTEKRGSRCSNS